MYSTEPTTMRLSEKNFLLGQIAGVLSELQCLVSKLQSVKCEDDEEKCQNNVRSRPDEESMSDVNIISWDSSHDFPVYPTTPRCFYNLVFPDSSDDEEIEACLSNNYQEKPIVKECPFVSKLKTFISSNFPNFIYTKEKSAELQQQRLNELVFEEFQCLWKNVDDLFVQNPDPSQSCTTPPPVPVVRYKSIDFSKVNIRNMANIPKPSSHPIHGCSQDPKFYSEEVVLSYDYYNRPHKLESSHKKSMPFGCLYGYQTNEGIVPVPTTPVNGHVWSDDLRDWVLHAVYPDECSAARAPWTSSRTPTWRRPPSTRRGRWTSRPRREGKGWRQHNLHVSSRCVFVMSHTLHLTICIDIHQSINITPTIHNALACS